MVMYVDVLGGAEVYKDGEFIGTVNLNSRADCIPYQLKTFGAEDIHVELKRGDKLEIFGAIGVVFSEMNNPLPMVQNLGVQVEMVRENSMDLIIEKNFTMISNNGYAEKVRELVDKYKKTLEN